MGLRNTSVLGIGALVVLLACDMPHCTLGDGPCGGGAGSVNIIPWGCVTGVQLSYEPSYETVGPSPCKPLDTPGPITVYAPLHCPPSYDATFPACTGMVTVTCSTGEVDTFDVTWEKGCTPVPDQQVVCAAFDAGVLDTGTGDGSPVDVTSN